MENDLPRDDEQQPPLERRLATILMADVAGYSRMMGKDEERTVQMLRGHRQVFATLLAAHRGRIFNTAGDAILAEFPSAVEAVRCATEIQSALRTRNEHYPEEERMWFRIGINLGDVIVQGTDLLGDGVNVAARIQTIAEPGGVCISGSVYDQIQNKLTLQFKLMGERSFKNIAQPIRTFSIAEANGTAMPVTLSPPKGARDGKKVFVIVAGLCVLFVLAGAGAWLYRDHQARRTEGIRQANVAELQTAETKRLALEAEKVRAEKERIEQERAAAKEAQRREHEARLAAEAQAAREALVRAEIEKQRLALELKQEEMEKRTTATPPERAPDKAARVPVRQAPAATVTAQPPAPASPATVPASEVKAAALFDGRYEGHFCNERSARYPERQCWNVQLEVEQGKISATWLVRRLDKTGRVQGTISADGEVVISLDGWTQDGKPTSAGLTGKGEHSTINAAGRWQGGREITGEWHRGN